MEAKDFRALRISLASPEQILSWSYGEVTKPETINYRRLRPEKDGLFCEAIFGPTKDWQCYCGKYKNIRYKGIICDKCGVEVTRSSVRRERMGHITLAAPVAHVWYTRRVPSYLGLLLDISRRNLDRVLYFAQYVITHVDEDARQKALKRIDEELARHEAQLDDALDGELGDLRTARDADLETLQAQIADINEHFNNEFARISDTIIREARALQERIEGMIGDVFSADLVFESAGTIIGSKGEKVTNDHISAVQSAVNASLNELQIDIEEHRKAEIAEAEQGINKRSTDAARDIEEHEAEKQQSINHARATAQESRSELQSLQTLQFLGEPKYRELRAKYGQVFKADMGAEAFYEILSHMDLDKLAKELWHEVRSTRSKQRKKKATKRLRVVESLRKSDNRPEWMILSVLPVIPPDLRPMVQLDGGRFATSDLNDLYRRVINRNNRLKRLLELGAPDVIVRNEKRMLQEAVDSLIDNSQRGKALSRRGRRELKSLSDMLKGKKGRFRRNLLGKRVDYSGRSVIVIGPKLKLYQCGLPKTMALELFRPFVISKLVQYNYASNVKGAKRIIESEKPEVWEVLEEVIKERPVLLNRAPTLHRLGIQAFEPLLVEGKAIQIHPLVCAAFNADFDGDQMAVHVPLSDKAVQEARELMLSSRNLLKPADGAPIVGPAKDMVLGNYYLTMDPNADIVALRKRADEFRHWSSLEGKKIGVAKDTTGARVAGQRDLAATNEVVVFADVLDEDGKPVRGQRGVDQLIAATVNGDVDCMLFNGHDMQEILKANPDWPLAVTNLSDRRLVVDMDEVEYLYGLGMVDLHTPILLGNYYDNLPAPPEPAITTIGRAVFNRILPDVMRFTHQIMDKKALQTLVTRSYQVVGGDETTEVVDAIKNLGFHYATVSGTTIAVSDLTVPEERDDILARASAIVDEAERSFRRGLLTEEERYQITIDSWTKAKSDLSDVIKNQLDPFGPIAIMALSGSTKGGFGPITQLAGMRGLMADPSGRIIDLPIQSHFRMGLDALEYFISSHGARKGLADTALRTADAGYLTRRLVDVAQDVIVNSEDCGSETGIWIRRRDDIAGQKIQERIAGRFAAGQVVNPQTGEIIVGRNEMITDDLADEIAAAGVPEILVRSPMTCNLLHGICVKCYGRDLGRGEVVSIGSAVGIVAAQSIGEPGTQLTLRTFHTGGTAQASGDITSGLPRVEELFEARKKPKGEAVMTDIAGIVRLSKTPEGVRIATVIDSEVFNEEHAIPAGYELLVEDEQQVKEGQEIAREADGEGVVLAGMNGQIYIEADKVYIRFERREEVEYEIPSSARLMPDVFDGAHVTAGQQLTEGAKNPHRILRILGAEATQLYLLGEVQKVYRSQGVPINDKHFEIIIRKMLSKAQITRSGDTHLLPGELIDKLDLLKINEMIMAQGGSPAAGIPVLLGVTKAALSTDSFLSASSFQHTIKVLAGAAIEGKKDPLHGLKENVIIGKLIPAGTGFHTYRHLESEAVRITLERESFVNDYDDEEDDYDDIDDVDDYDDEVEGDLSDISAS